MSGFLSVIFLTGCNTSFKNKKLSHAHGNHTDFKVEKIYICSGYFKDFDSFYQYTINFLKAKQAKKVDDYWKLTDTRRSKSYEIRIIEDIESVDNALMTEDSHVIIRGHANFGLGPVFLMREDNKIRLHKKSVLDKIKFIDDRRILPISSEWIAIPVSNIRKNNKLTNWWPKYSDGTSGIAPYKFNNAKEELAYNYYLTYQVSGDPKYYKILDNENRPIERFPLSGKEPWFSIEGKKPDPSNPLHKKHFITGEQPAFIKNEFRAFGNWQESRDSQGYYNENFLFSKKNTGGKYAKWHFQVLQSGRYTISSWLPYTKEMVTEVTYSLKKKHPKRDRKKSHQATSTSQIMNIKSVYNKDKCCQWHEILQMDLDPGNYVLTMKPVNDEGTTIADAVRIANVGNPKTGFMPFFFVAKSHVNVGDLVTFFSKSKGEIYSYIWDFGDGNKIKTTKAYCYHRYKKTGIYSVSLVICGYNSNKALKKTKKGYIHVGVEDQNSQPEFTAYPDTGTLPLKVRFTDRSTGEINKWHWDFGDGHTSEDQNPEHIYLKSGNYDVTLTITNKDGLKKQYVKKQYIDVSIFDTVIDNVVYPVPHYSIYTMIKGNGATLKPNTYRYKRLFFDSCNVERYFLDSLKQGVVFYSKKVSNSEGLFVYLELYLNGESDAKILKKLNILYPSAYGLFDFNRKRGVLKNITEQ